MILLIDTALETASVGLVKEGKVIAYRENARQNDHAAWLHPAIQSLLNETGFSISKLLAVGVSAGPGSYTGLRVGMAAAKGICYTQNIPLISVSTLQILASGVQEELGDVIISLIDARRDEVYAGVYDKELNSLEPEQALKLSSDAWLFWRKNNKVIFTGNGAQKALNALNIKDLPLSNSKNGILNLAGIVTKKWLAKDFADLAYHEPVYLKEFFNTVKDR